MDGCTYVGKAPNRGYLSFFVANYILGGSGFGSRLTTEVRKRDCLTVFSGFSLLKQKGPFFIGFSDWQAKYYRCFKSSSGNTY